MTRSSQKSAPEFRLFRDLVEKMAAATCVVRAEDGIVVYANPAMENLFSYRFGDLTGKHFRSTFASNQLESEDIAIKIITALHTGRSWHGDVKCIKKNSDEFWAKLELTKFEAPLHGETWVLNYQDITTSKYREGKYYNSDEQYQSLVESLPDIVYTFSNKRGGIYYSSYVQKVLGYSAEYLCVYPKLWNESIHPDDRERVRRVINELSENKPFDIEYRIKDAHGRWVWLRDRSIGRFEHDGEIVIKGLASDITRQKLAEDVLNESEERLRQVIEQMPYPVEICDPGGTAQLVNKAFLDLLNIPSAKLIVNQYNVFNDTLVMENMGLAETIRRVYAGESVFLPNISLDLGKVTGQFGIQHENDIVFEATMFPVFRKNGEIWRVVTIWKDISDRKKAEVERETLLKQVMEARDEAASAKDQLMALLERVSDGFVALDKGFNYTYVNSFGGVLLGRKAEDLIGKNYWTEYPEARNTVFAQAYIRAFETQQPIFLEEYYEQWGRWFANRIYPSEEGITIFFNDITERKRAEEALIKSEEKFRMIAETIREVFWIADVDLQRMTYISPSYETVWGLSCQSLYDDPKSFIAAIHPEDRERVARQLEIKTTGQPFEYEYRIVRPDGSIRWILDHGYPYHKSDGTVKEYIGSARDITERKIIEENLREREQELQRLLKTQSDPG